MEKELWTGKKWWVSPYNFEEETRKKFNLPKNVIFHDVTLRDGEQTPGVVLRKNEKIEIARALDAIGVQRIEAGMPVVSKDDRDAVYAIAHEGMKAEIYGFNRMVRTDIDESLSCDVSGVIIEGPTGVPKLKQFNWTEDEVIGKALDTVDYAKSHGLKVAFFSVDMSRANFTFLKKLLGKVSNETKVDSFVVVDTFGCAIPEAIKYLVKMVKQVVKKPIEVHCHNDFGLGTACALAGISAGADVVHTSVCGIGERSGNSPFEETALSLKLLYGLDVKLNFEKLFKLSRIVEKYSGVKIPNSKSVIGKRVFTREAGIPIAGWIKYNLGSESYLPDLVGNTHGVLLGKKSGKHSIEWKLQKMGIKISENKIQTVVDEVKRKSELIKGPISENEFKKILQKIADPVITSQ